MLHVFVAGSDTRVTWATIKPSDPAAVRRDYWRFWLHLASLNIQKKKGDKIYKLK